MIPPCVYIGIQRYLVLSLDEIKIQMASYNELPTHVHALAFLVRGVATDLKYTLAYFLTEDVTS